MSICKYSDDDFRRLHYLFENNLKPTVCLGYHSHNNLQLAYSNAIDFIQIRNSYREIILDSSIHGMGRGAGNLTTELVSDYLNKRHHTNYNIVPLLNAIDQHLEVVYKENYWGYSIAHFLSASFSCHPNYASYLVNTKTLSIVDMQTILGTLSSSERTNFSRSRIEELYISYKSSGNKIVSIDPNIFKNEDILIIAPGPNSIQQKELVDKYINDNTPIIIAVNHIPTNYAVNYYFFSNQKRFDKFKTQLFNKRVIITTNVKVESNESIYAVVDYHDLVMMTSNKNDNVTILLINLLTTQGVKKVSVAGLDGYRYDIDNYAYNEEDRVIDKKILDQHNMAVSQSLEDIRRKLSINILTESIFNENK